MTHKKIACMKCGATNSPETIFCTGCGALLSASEGKRRRIHHQHVRAAFQWAVLLVVFAVLGAVGLALWPRSGALGMTGSLADAEQLARNMHNLSVMDGAREEVGRDFSEAGVNAYIQHFCLKNLGFEALSVDLFPEGVRLRLLEKPTSCALGGYCLAPTFSLDLTLAVIEKQATLQRAALGHLPLPGAPARKAFARLRRELRKTPEIKLLAKVRRIAIGENRLHVTFGGEK